MRRVHAASIAVLIIGVSLLGVGYAVADVRPDSVVKTDVLVYGTSLGGASAALTLAREGQAVVLAGPSGAIGGQAVDAGVSAFADANRKWERYGIYGELFDFLRQKYPDAPEGHAGAGLAVVGSIATVPGDIHEFFSTKLREAPAASVLLGYDLVSVSKSGSRFSRAILRHPKTKKTLEIQFTYLVDGTERGDVFAKAKVPVRIGFDAREDTKEMNALPAEARSALIDAIGNRTQPISAMVALADRGYAGDAYAFSSPPACAEQSGKGWISGMPQLRMKSPDCAVSTVLQPASADMFDMFVVGSGRGPWIAEVGIADAARPLSLTLRPASQTTYLRIGTFPAGPGRPLSLRISAATNDRIDGIVLLKKNLSSVARLPSYTADIYVVLEKGTTAPLFVRIDDRRMAAALVGSRTYRLPDVSMTSSSRLSCDASCPKDAAIIVTHVALADAPNSVRFPLADAKKVNAKSLPATDALRKANDIREWSVTPVASGPHLLVLDSWQHGMWGTVQLRDATTNAVVYSSAFTRPGLLRQGTMLAVPSLTAGRSYALRIGISQGSILTADLRLAPVQGGNALYAKQAPVTVPQALDGAAADVWVRGPAGVPVSVTLPGETLTETVSNPGVFQYAGKILLTAGASVAAAGDAELVLVPNTAVDVWSAVMAKDAAADLPLPPGMYRMTAVPVQASQQKTLNVRVGSSSLRLSGAQGVFVTDKAFVHGGGVLSLAVDAAMRVYITEEFPRLPVNSFTAQHPLFRPSALLKDLRKEMSVFNYRNIVSPQSARSGVQPSLPNVSGDTLGTTILSYPSSDYFPIQAATLDDTSSRLGAQRLAYALYHWMKHDVPNDSKLLGCTPANAPVCDARRIALLTGVLGVHSSPYASVPHLREARRLQSVRPISERDILLSYLRCAAGECSAKTCAEYSQGDAYCIAKSQPASLPTDALAAVHYPIDSHGFLSAPDRYSPLISDFFTRMVASGVLEKDELTVLRRTQRGHPWSVTLGSLLPADGSNMFPASMNFGVTQIAGMALRVHTVELAVGQAVGHVLAFALQKNTSPSLIADNPQLLKEMQRHMVEKGMTLYPVEDMNADDLLRKAVQYLLIAGVIRIEADLSGQELYYQSRAGRRVSFDDSAMMRTFFAHTKESLSYEALIRFFIGADQKLSAAELRKEGMRLGLVDVHMQAMTPKALLQSVVTKAALYRAIYLYQFQHPAP